MLRSRVSPCLLLHNNGLVKTIKFSDKKYIGDPLNAVKIFNEKEVDELIFLDIDATVNGVAPNYKLIEHLAAQSRMPLCYGGGIKNAEQALKIIRLGVEKVALSSAALNDYSLVSEVSRVVGRQSVVIVIDVKKTIFGSYDVFTHNGKRKHKESLNLVIETLEKLGIGELVVNSIDQDGTMKGYDLKLVERVRNIFSGPLTVIGGAADEDDIVNLIDRYQIIGASAGSAFVFKGTYRAVLISYLSDSAKKKIREISDNNWMKK